MDLKEVEKKWQKAWKENHVFEPDVDESKPKFFFTVPYPYTSGALHIGHGRTYVIGDVIVRYHRLSGYSVLWPMAFHVTGTPILAISDSIRRGDEKVIKLYKDYIRIYESDEEKVEEILKSFKDPKNVAEFFASKISADFDRIGLAIDWRRKFNTITPQYSKFVEWQYYKLKEKGLITQGKHPVLYSPVDESAVGEDDIKDGDTDKVEIEEFTGIKFKFEDGYIIASTLRPETIFGVTNLWVNPDGTYVKAKVDGEVWYISKEAFEKLKYQKEKVELIEEIEGKYFVDKKAEIFDKLLPILPAQFVDTDNATGFVYSVPAHAPYDYIALKELDVNIQPIKIIEIEGYSDLPAKQVVEEFGITSQNDPKLEEATKKVYKDEYYKGVLNENCGKFAGLKIKEIKDKVRNWLIEKGLATIFYETSRKAVTRAGNKVIVAVLRDQWFIDYSQKWWKEKSKEWTKKMLFYPEKYRQVVLDTIDWLHERPCARKRGLGTRFPFDKEWIIESLSDSTIYMAFYTIADRVMKIEPEKLKPEFFDYVFLGKGSAEEVAKITGIPKEEIEEMRKEFLYWYPNDLRHTAPMHLSNHLTFFIMHHVAIFPEEFWPRGISINEVVIREGAKMSKSKGNVIPLAHVSELYGADLYRLYIVSAANLDTMLDWKDKEVEVVRKKLDKFISIAEEALDAEDVVLDEIDQWLIDSFYETAHEVRALFNSFRFKDAVIKLFFEMLNKIRVHERIAGKERNRAVVKKFLFDWAIALSPFIPHIAEEIWHHKENSFVCNQKWPDKNIKANRKVGLLVEEAQKIFDDIRQIIKIVGRKPGEIKIIVSEKGDFESEFNLLSRIKDEIEEEFNAKVTIEKQSESKEEKAAKAKPFKPAIVIR